MKGSLSLSSLSRSDGEVALRRDRDAVTEGGDAQGLRPLCLWESSPSDISATLKFAAQGEDRT